MSTAKTSPAPGDSTSPPKFKIDYAATSRSKCKNCSHGIVKDVLRLGVLTVMDRGKPTYSWRHWGCIKPSELEAIQQIGNLSDVSGYSDLLEEDQIRLSKAVESGRISAEDIQEQRKKTDVEEGAAAAAEGSKEEEEKRERKKSRKRKEIEEAEEAKDNGSPKKKKKKAKDQDISDEPTVISKSTKATLKEPEAPAEVVPDSEDDSLAASVKKKTDEEETSKTKAKASPKKAKEKASKASAAEDDVAMAVDDKEAPADAKSKPRANQKKTPAAADDKKKPGPKPKVTDAETTPATKATKAKPKETTKKAAAKKLDSDGGTLTEKDATKAKATTTATEADKTTKPPATSKLAQPNSDTSDHAAGSPSPYPHPNPNTSPLLDILAPLLRSSYPPSAVHPPNPPPRVPLARFCKKYKLPATLQTKLSNLGIDGAHVLRLVKDHDLTSLGGLSIGELASLRDAEQRWLVDCYAGTGSNTGNGGQVQGGSGSS